MSKLHLLTKQQNFSYVVY